MSGDLLNLTLRVWRQECSESKGTFRDYQLQGVSTHMSFLEMLDVLNEKLTQAGDEPVAFDHDCREGICGMCSLMINGQAHGPDRGTTTCQLHMRRFRNGDTIVIEPWRASAFPVLRDLVVDRSAFDRVIQAGGYVSVNTGNAPDGNAIPVPGHQQELAMDAAACIGCGACVELPVKMRVPCCLSLQKYRNWRCPQGQPERATRVIRMVAQIGSGRLWILYEHIRMRSRLSGGDLALSNIARLNREYARAVLTGEG